MSDFSGILTELAGGAVVVVGGLPGLGKSTLTRKSANETGAAVVSVDAIRESHDCYTKACARIATIHGGVVVDACALSPDYRAALVPKWRRKAAVWIRADVDLASARRPKITDLRKMAAIASAPTLAEGFVFVLEVNAT